MMPTITFRAAALQDIPAVVALVESAYRGDASRAGWTTEADFLEGQRIDAAGVKVLYDDRKGVSPVVICSSRANSAISACSRYGPRNRAPASANR